MDKQDIWQRLRNIEALAQTAKPEGLRLALLEEVWPLLDDVPGPWPRWWPWHKHNV